MRILFTSTAGSGHLNPLFPVARAARAAGHDVLFTLPAISLGQPAALGFAARPTDSGIPGPDELAFWQSLPSQPDGNTAVFGEYFGRLRVHAAFEPMGAVVADFRPDVVVSEQGEFAGWLHAELCGVPHLTVGIASTAVPGADFTPMIDNLDAIRVTLGLPATGRLPWKHRTQFVTGVPEVLQLASERLPANALRFRYEDPEGAPTPVDRTGTGRLRVYATLGTAAARQPQVAGAYAAVIGALGQLDADVLFTAGAFDTSQLGPIPANVTVAAYLPQEQTMDVDVVVGHGGSGTTSAALARGIPMVVVPLFADQQHNSIQLARAGAGVAVDARRLATDLAPAVATVAADPGYRNAARRIARDIAALPTVGEVLDRVLAAAALPVG